MLKKVFLGIMILFFSWVSAFAQDTGADFQQEASYLYRTLACKDIQAAPASQQPLFANYCKQFAKYAAYYRKVYIETGVPFLASLRPANLPKVVVYPFGGNDLAAALASYPDADEFNTISLENAGDPRPFAKASAPAVRKELAWFTQLVRRMLVFHDHSSKDTHDIDHGLIPGQVSLSLIAAAQYGYEPVSLKFFRVEKDGSLHYYSHDEIKQLEKVRAKGLSKTRRAMKFSVAFHSMEIVYSKAETGKKIIHRHFGANLDNHHFKNSPLQAHLLAKGKVSAMTKGASYLMWFNYFSEIRDYLLQNMSFMYSDATGILPKYAKAAGFSYTTYGRFTGAFLENNGGQNAKDLAREFARQPYRKMPFRYGHADMKNQWHLIIMIPGR